MITTDEAYFVRLNNETPYPSWGSPEAAGVDLYLPEAVTLRPREFLLVPLGLIAIPPKGFHWEIVLRSSAPIKFPGLFLTNSIGIIDSDYCGPKDEIKINLLNQSKDNILFIPKHTRIVQMLLRHNIRAQIRELSYEEIQQQVSRGGFGSSGQ